MDTVKVELDSEDDMHLSNIEPQFVDMKQEDLSEPFIVIDKFEAEVGHMLDIWRGLGSSSCTEVLIYCTSCLLVVL
jgi:hypothetical protein